MPTVRVSIWGDSIHTQYEKHLTLLARRSVTISLYVRVFFYFTIRSFHRQAQGGWYIYALTFISDFDYFALTFISDFVLRFEVFIDKHKVGDILSPWSHPLPTPLLGKPFLFKCTQDTGHRFLQWDSIHYKNLFYITFSPCKFMKLIPNSFQRYKNTTIALNIIVFRLGTRS